MSCVMGKKRYFFHLWGKWSVKDESDIIRTRGKDGSRAVIGKRLEQTRQCERCDKIQIEVKETLLSARLI